MLHRGRARHLAQQLRRLNLVGRVGDADVAVADDGFVLGVGRIKLAQILNDEQCLHAIARDERQRFLEHVQLAQRRKLVDGQQQPVRVARLAAALIKVHAFGEPPHRLVQDQAQKGLEAVLVRRRHHKVQAGGLLHQGFQREVRNPRVLSHNWVAVQREKRQRGGLHARRLVARLVEERLRGLRRGPPAMRRELIGQAVVEHGMRRVADRGHHGGRPLHALASAVLICSSVGQLLGQFTDRAAVGQNGLHGGERLVLDRVIQQHEQHDPGHQVEAGFGPVVVQALAVRVDNHGGDVLYVLDQIAVHADFHERIEAGRIRAGRVELDAALTQRLAAPAGCEVPAFALDVVDQHRMLPGQQRGQDDAHALAGARWRERQDVFRPSMAQVLVVVIAKKHPACILFIGQQSGGLDLFGFGPVRRTVQIVLLACSLARAPECQGHRHQQRQKPAHTHDEVRVLKDFHDRQAVVERVVFPRPHQDVEREIHGGRDHGFAQHRTPLQCPGGVFRGGPHRDQHDHGEQAQGRPHEAGDVLLRAGDVVQVGLVCAHFFAPWGWLDTLICARPATKKPGAHPCGRACAARQSAGFRTSSRSRR